MKENFCLQDKTGVCSGCNVLEIACCQARRVPVERRGEVIRRIENQLCPTIGKMLVPSSVPQNIW